MILPFTWNITPVSICLKYYLQNNLQTSLKQMLKGSEARRICQLNLLFLQCLKLISLDLCSNCFLSRKCSVVAKTSPDSLSCSYLEFSSSHSCLSVLVGLKIVGLRFKGLWSGLRTVLSVVLREIKLESRQKRRLKLWRNSSLTSE